MSSPIQMPRPEIRWSRGVALVLAMGALVTAGCAAPGNAVRTFQFEVENAGTAIINGTASSTSAAGLGPTVSFEVPPSVALRFPLEPRAPSFDFHATLRNPSGAETRVEDVVDLAKCPRGTLYRFTAEASLDGVSASTGSSRCL